MSNEEMQSEEKEVVQQEVETTAVQEVEQLSEEQNSEEIVDEIDYSELNREDLLTHLKELNNEGSLQLVGARLTKIRRSYDSQKNELKNEALQIFINDGGNEDDFEFRQDDIARKFDELASILQDRVKVYYREQDEQKKANVHKKRNLVDELRNIVDGKVEGNAFQQVKTIQENWKTIGAIPASDNRELWASYKALLDRFYNNQSIYFDLLELDRKKNLQAKIALCEKAEALVDEEGIGEALKSLHQLHDEYKHIGPVPKEQQEELWQRFKKASDDIYDKRREQNAEFEKSLEENHVKKQAVIERVKEFQGFDTDSIKEWNKKTDELVLIQEEWKAIGPIPEGVSKELSKEFWSYCKGFFNTKRSFFKKLDGQREENLQLKTQLCEKVEGLKGSDQDFEKTADEIKKLQEQWRTIGQVPRKFNDSIYERFRKACDEFFDQRRAQRKTEEQEFEVNLEKKEAICEAINALGEGDTEAYQTKVEEFNELGYVPRRAIKKIAKSFEQASKAFIEKQKDLDSQEKTKLELSLELASLKGHPNAGKILNRKRGEIRDKIGNLNNEIQTLKTNIQFFANSKNIAQLEADVNSKIDVINEDIYKLKDQLSILNDFR